MRKRIILFGLLIVFILLFLFYHYPVKLSTRQPPNLLLNPHFDEGTKYWRHFMHHGNAYFQKKHTTQPGYISLVGEHTVSPELKGIFQYRNVINTKQELQTKLERYRKYPSETTKQLLSFKVKYRITEEPGEILSFSPQLQVLLIDGRMYQTPSLRVRAHHSSAWNTYCTTIELSYPPEHFILYLLRDGISGSVDVQNASVVLLQSNMKNRNILLSDDCHVVPLEFTDWDLSTPLIDQPFTSFYRGEKNITDITLLTHLPSVHHLSQLKLIVNVWKGPIIVSIYENARANDHKVLAEYVKKNRIFVKFVTILTYNDPILSDRRNILNNALLQKVVTSHVFFLETHFIPSQNARDQILDHIKEVNNTNTILSVPKIEIDKLTPNTYTKLIPSSKDELDLLFEWRRASFYPRDLHEQNPDISIWRDATSLYEKLYNPHDVFSFVAPTSLLHFDQRLSMYNDFAPRSVFYMLYKRRTQTYITPLTFVAFLNTSTQLEAPETSMIHYLHEDQINQWKHWYAFCFKVEGQTSLGSLYFEPAHSLYLDFGDEINFFLERQQWVEKRTSTEIKLQQKLFAEYHGRTSLFNPFFFWGSFVFLLFIVLSTIHTAISGTQLTLSPFPSWVVDFIRFLFKLGLSLYFLSFKHLKKGKKINVN